MTPTPDQLARLARRLARADDALEEAAEHTLARVAQRGGASLAIDFRSLATEPEEIALRVLKRAVSGGSPASEMPYRRLERLEDCLDDLRQHLETGIPLRRTLAGRLLHLDSEGTLTISPEGVRHRGRGDAVTPIENRVLPSLGRDPRRA